MRSRSAEKLSKHCVLSARMIREYAMPACRFLFHRISSMKRMGNGLNEPREDFIGTRVFFSSSCIFVVDFFWLVWLNVLGAGVGRS